MKVCHVKPHVDLVVLMRCAGPLRPEVERGIIRQHEVELIVHRVVGKVSADDRCRWDAIARARNEGKLKGRTPWLMFLDDDVELSPGCVAALLSEIGRRPMYGGLAADYLGQRRQGQVARHVSMGATLFRREALEQVRFTWCGKRCECQCCCDDLRRSHWAIDYCSSAKAIHLPKAKLTKTSAPGSSAACPSNEKVPARILTGFNRRHYGLFRARFLSSLRASGNQDVVIPFAIGLYPSERRRIAAIPGVRPVFGVENGQTVARRRLYDFAEITSRLPHETPVAYWDAGDVIFQGRLEPLWQLVRAHPDKLLAAREPSGHPDNPAAFKWTNSITDPAARRQAQQTIFYRAFINGGFAAGTAKSMTRYFRTVANWYDIPKLGGSWDWGDQLALNVYCHSRPDEWHEIPEGWNYCLCRRNRKSVYRRENGRYVDVRGVPVHVVHGNANSLGAAAFRRATF
jgi:hypothetical protein